MAKDKNRLAAGEGTDSGVAKTPDAIRAPHLYTSVVLHYKDKRPYNERDHEILQFTKSAQPVITCELYSKWYFLYIWWTEFSLYRLEFDDLEKSAAELGVSAFVDHVPNPRVVRHFAEANDYVIDELADDIITGRWHNEVV